jgi:tetratricopeptide (TPR) repeat protein/energy-coupling factor transporter ATP-binding protein EcfA2
MKTAFLSSTARDLAKYRDAAYEAIEGLDDWHCRRMEDFGARDAMADEFCQEKVAECDVFVGIVGHCYGSSPEGSEKSYTEQEYGAAIATERSRLMFLAPKEFPLPMHLRESDEKWRKQRDFRDRVNAERIRAPFTSPEVLALRVVQAIRNWERKATGVVQELFKSRVRIIDEELFQHPASDEEVSQYYDGAQPLTWNIVAAQGVIERDQQAELLERLLTPSGQIQMICIVGEAGAGKSSLAWQLARQLTHQQDNSILQILDNTDDDIWYRLPDFWVRTQQPFHALVDDVFRDESVLRAFKVLDPNLPMVILATSRANEYRGDEGLPFPVERVDLPEPSPAEKNRILSRLGKEWAQMAAEERARVSAANQMLILMAELTTGKGFIRFIRDTLNRLRQHDEVVYRAYEYLCYTYQYDISIPASLLERLDDKGRFYRLLDKRAAKGLIFADKSQPGNLQVGHPVRAEHAAKLYGRDPRSIFGEILEAVDVKSRVERHFVTHLLREMARRASESRLPDILECNAAVIQDIQREATISEMIIWHTLYQDLGHQEEAKRCVDVALSKNPTSRQECFSLRSLCQKQQREAAVLPMFRQWLEHAPEDYQARPVYLSLVKRHAPEQLPEVIEETSVWLAKHPEDHHVRQAYLGLAVRKGTAEQVGQVIVETSAWLADHPENSSVRRTYLAVMKRHGLAALLILRRHIEHAADDHHARAAYLNLVEHHAPEQLPQVIEKTAAWLAERPREVEIRKTYLGLVRHKGTLEQKAQAVRNTRPYLSNYTKGSFIYVSYLTFVSQLAGDKQGIQLLEQEYLEDARKRYGSIIAKEARNKGALYGYGRLLLGLEEFAEAAKQFRALLKLHKGHTAARRGLALALNGLGECRQAEDEFKYALWWAENVTDYPANILHHDLGIFYLDQERYTEAQSEFEKAIKEYPEGFANYWRLGEVLIAQGDYRNAAIALQTALDKAPQDLSPPASEEIPALLDEAERILESCGGR